MHDIGYGNTAPLPINRPVKSPCPRQQSSNWRESQVFRNLKIRSKLIWLACVPILGSILVTVLAVYNIQGVTSTMR